jgi:hypothetical protein
MINGLRIALALTALLATAAISAAAKPGKPDCAAALPAVQDAVAASQCSCETAANHGQFVRCAGQVVKGLVATQVVDHRCKGAMVRVFAKSSCGKTNSVTCCFADRACKVKKSVACARLGGTPGSTPFCSDACLGGSPSGAFVD